MFKATQESIEDLFEWASSEGRCVFAGDDSLQRLLYRHVGDGYITQPWKGLFALKEDWEKLSPCEQTRRIVKSLSLKHPSWIFYGATAATMFGLEVASSALRPLQLATTRRSYLARNDGRIEWHLLKNRETELVDGVLVTCFDPTLLDCLGSLGFRHALAIADSALRVHNMKKSDLLALAKAYTGDGNRQQVLDVANWANSLAANGGESVARAVMIEQGFMVPQLQVKIPDLIDGGVYYADFKWDLPDGTCVVGELDGLDKYVDPQMTGGRSVLRVMADERRRESRIGAAGMRVMRFSYSEVLDTERFCRLLETYGIPRGPARPNGHYEAGHGRL